MRTRGVGVALGAVVAPALCVVAGCGSSRASGGLDTSSPRAATVTATTTAPTTPTTPAATAATTAASGSPAACRTADLSVTQGQHGVGSGMVATTILFTNTGSAACVISGYPGVSVIGSDGATVGSPATRSASAVTPVRLAPGATASDQVLATDRSSSDPNGSCTETGPTLRVFPPDQTQSVSVAYAETVACGLGVTAVVAGSTGHAG